MEQKDREDVQIKGTLYNDQLCSDREFPQWENGSQLQHGLRADGIVWVELPLAFDVIQDNSISEIHGAQEFKESIQTWKVWM